MDVQILLYYTGSGRAGGRSNEPRTTGAHYHYLHKIYALELQISFLLFFGAKWSSLLYFTNACNKNRQPKL